MHIIITAYCAYIQKKHSFLNKSSQQILLSGQSTPPACQQLYCFGHVGLQAQISFL